MAYGLNIHTFRAAIFLFIKLIETMKQFYATLMLLLMGMVLFAQADQIKNMDQYGLTEREQFTKTIQLASVENLTDFSEWALLGPNGGDVLDVAIDPLNVNHIFAAAGAPFVSEDGGENWTILDGLSSISAGLTTSIESNSDGVLLAGGLYSFKKVYRSIDGGINWTSVTLPINSYILDIAIDPSDPNTAFLALAANGTSSKVLLKSSNAGTSWTIIDLISAMPNGFSLINIIIDPDNNQNLYGIGNSGISDAMVVASFDGGENWSDITGDLPQNKPYNGLAIADGRVYLAGGQLYGSQVVGVYKTENNGGHWQNISSSFPIKVSNCVLVDPNDHNNVYVGSEGDGVYSSTDGGFTWNFDGSGAGSNGSARSLIFSPNDSQVIYAGFLSHAVCKSTDAAQSWQYANKGIATLMLNDIEVNTTDPNVMLVAFEGENTGGCYLSNDAGENWALLESLPATRFSQVAFGADGSMYVWSNGPTTIGTEGLYKSIDDGASWENLGPFMGPNFETQIFTLEVSESNPGLFLIGGNNFGSFGWESMIYRTDDGGETWTNTFMGLANDSFRYLHIDPLMFNQIIYAAFNSGNSEKGGLLKSTDSGINWEPITLGIPDVARWCGVITSDPQSPEILYAGIGGYGGMAGSVYRSENAGATWEYANLGLSDNYAKITDIVVSPNNSEVIYAATSSEGVYISSDTAFSWSLNNENLPATNVSRFSNPFMKDGAWKLCASTITNSAFVTDIFIPNPSGIFSSGQDASFFKVFPNPSNGKFIIELGDGSHGSAEIKIFNQQGLEVYSSLIEACAENLIQPPIELPSGIWMLRLVCGKQAFTEKIIVL
jgi:photosystem II stability/assembly factor-like uncharacterized protein